MQKSHSKTNATTTIALLLLTVVVFGSMLCMAGRNIGEKLSTKLPKSYASLMDQSIKNVDTVALCKDDYSKDMANPKLKADGKIPEYISSSITICNKFELAVMQSKKDAEDFFKGDVYKKIQSNESVGWIKMFGERDKILKIIDFTNKSVLDYSAEKNKYRAEVVTPEFTEIKASNKLFMADAQLKTRIEAADLALASKDYSRFLKFYNEIKSYIDTQESKPLEHAG